MCLPWTWFLACLFQLKLIAAPCLILYKWKPYLSLILISVLTVLSLGLHFYLSFLNNYAPNFYKTLPLNSKFEYENSFGDYIHEVKAKPYVSFMSFAPGLVLGLQLFENPPETVEIGPRRALFIWMVAGSLLVCSLGSNFLIDFLTVNEAVYVLTSLAPFLWSVGICLIAYVTLHRRDWASAFLSAKIFIIINIEKTLYFFLPFFLAFSHLFIERPQLFQGSRWTYDVIAVVTCPCG